MFQPDLTYVKLLRSINNLFFIHKEYTDRFGNTKYMYLGAFPINTALDIQLQAFDCGDYVHLTSCTSKESLHMNGDKMLLN